MFVFADQHDGDQKSVSRRGDEITIRPHANNETWVVSTLLNASSCAAVINFNVQGKPSPPPVNLTATFWAAVRVRELAAKIAIEFTDPTSTISASSDYPLNYWIQLDS